MTDIEEKKLAERLRSEVPEAISHRDLVYYRGWEEGFIYFTFGRLMDEYPLEEVNQTSPEHSMLEDLKLKVARDIAKERSYLQRYFELSAEEDRYRKVPYDPTLQD